MLYCVLICLGVVALDRISKLIVMHNFDIGESMTLIPGVVDIHRIEPNRGAAFGSFANARWVFMTVSVIAIAAIIWYLVKEKPKSPVIRTSLAAVAGGGIGNMIDRVAYGAVEDFIDVTCTDFFCFKYVFNVADVFVTVGCVTVIFWLLVTELLRMIGAKKKKAAAPVVGDGSEKSDD